MSHFLYLRGQRCQKFEKLNFPEILISLRASFGNRVCLAGKGGRFRNLSFLWLLIAGWFLLISALHALHG